MMPSNHSLSVECYWANEVGWNPFKSLAKAAGSVAKIATAPQRAVFNTARDIAKGKNVLKTLKQQGTGLVYSTLEGAKLLGNVATFIPGLGTGVAFAIQYSASVGDAIAHGKNVLASAKAGAITAALNSLPGGQLTGGLIRTVANVAVAGLKGQNLLKSAAHEVVASAVTLISNPQAQKLLADAADAAMKGQNVLQGVKASAIKQALAQVPDASARAVIEATLQGKAPADVVKGASASLLGRAAGAIPTGSAAALVTGIVGKNPNQIHALVSVAAADKVIDAAKLAKRVSPTAKGQAAVKARTNATLAKNLMVATATKAKAGDPVAAHMLAVVAARLKQRNEGRPFVYVLTPDGQVHLEPTA
jgi:hypothetical protein